MEKMTVATTLSQISESRQHPVGTVLRGCGKLVFAGLKSIGAAWFDPRNCSAYWIGCPPEMWSFRK